LLQQRKELKTPCRLRVCGLHLSQIRSDLRRERFDRTRDGQMATGWIRIPCSHLIIGLGGKISFSDHSIEGMTIYGPSRRRGPRKESGRVSSSSEASSWSGACPVSWS